MKKHLHIILYAFSVIFFSSNIYAQIVDNFSDGNFTENPPWVGSINDFIVNAELQLQLSMEIEDDSSAWLVTANNRFDDTEWRFYIQQKFSPSTNNFCRTYLCSDIENISDSLNGYFLQFGESGSDDAITLFKQTGWETTEILRATAGAISSSFAISVKVTYSENGNWKLFVDYSGGENYQLEAEATNANLIQTNYFGFFCKFTKSNSDKFYFDNIYVGDIIVDNQPPEVVSVDAISENQIRVVFSEYIDNVSSTNPQNYKIESPITFPQTIVYEDSAVVLVFEDNFLSGEELTIDIRNISDIAGNVMQNAQFNFLWYEAATWDITINELMVDPTPPVFLPQYEYIELYNTTNYPVLIENWSIKIAETVKIFPSGATISPKGYLLLCDDNAIEELSSFGTLAVFSSLALTNSGQNLEIYDNKNRIICRVKYSSTWYRNPEKANGGWSLEQIDAFAPCIGSANWSASENQNGGTPGSENSIISQLYEPPKISSVRVQDSANLLINFNQNMDSISLSEISTYNVLPNIGKPDSAIAIAPDFSSVRLFFSNHLQKYVQYTFQTNSDIFNCTGTPFSAGFEYSFSLPEDATLFEVVINEIMADPAPQVELPNAEYIELYNNSSKLFCLKDWVILLGDSPKTLPDILLEPNEYAIIVSEDEAHLFSDFGKSIPVDNLGLSNNGMPLTLLNEKNEIIHQVYYTIDWYNSSNKDDGGWSLEMIDPNNPCGEKNNWSASKSTTGGTPANENSIFGDNLDYSLPELLHILYKNENSIELVFDEFLLEKNLVEDVSKFQTIPSLGVPQSVEASGFGFYKALLTFPISMNDSAIYTLEIANDSICDCVGNRVLAGTTAQFGKPLAPDSNDIVINEILTNPYGLGKDYIELYNRSTKIINLSHLSISKANIDDGTLSTKFLPPFLLLPDQYCCLSKDLLELENQYLCPNRKSLLKMEDLQDFSSSEGEIVLAKFEDINQVVDLLNYNEDMHFPLLQSSDGVSLERLSANRPTNDETNWHSAAESVGFGTNDGFEDVLNIELTTAEPGFVATIIIYDAKGRQIRILKNNELLGSNNVFSWDGIQDNRIKAKIGVYIILVELYDLGGKTLRVKKSAVLGGQL